MLKIQIDIVIKLKILKFEATGALAGLGAAADAVKETKVKEKDIKKE